MPKILSHNEKLTLGAFFMWLAGATFYGYQFLLRVCPNVLADYLMVDLALDACALSVLVSFYYWGYAFFQVPAGIVIDRLGPRLPLTCAILLCSVGGMLFVSSSPLSVMSLGRLLTGVGSAFAFISCLKIIQTRFPKNLIPLFVGLTVALGTAGGVGGGVPLSLAVEVFGWRTVLWGLALFGIGLAVFVFFFIKLQPSPRATQSTQTSQHKSSVPKAIGQIMKNHQTWIIGMYGMLMYVPLSGFADMWGTLFVMKIYGVSKPIAAGSALTFYIGIACGSPFAALWGTWVGSHTKVMRLASLIACLLFALVTFVKLPFILTYVIFFSAGFCAGTQFLAFATVLYVNPNAIGATASGIHNMLCMISGIIFQPLMGYILELFWDGGRLPNGEPLYTAFAYQASIVLVPLALFGAHILSGYMKDSYRQV